ncbi:MAG TPA: amidohydrolase family protein [Acidobacteriaceae bacterium]|nr:amidohydrolase family protein [Acidobacteriaceae bacterium]
MRSPIPVLDCHGHIGVHPDFPACKSDADAMVAVMDLLNIERLAVTSTLACYNDCPRGNAEIEAVLRKHPTRFLGYVTVNPNPPGQAVAELERWAGFHRPPLIKLHPGLHKYPVHGEHYRPIWDYANRHGAVVLVHTWDSDPNCGPLLFPAIARAHPHARILLGHAGVTWRGYLQAMEAAESAPNLFLDLAGSQHHRLILERCVQRIGAERILFGSDMPFLEASMTLAHVLTACISDPDKERILRTNFLTLVSG